MMKLKMRSRTLIFVLIITFTVILLVLFLYFFLGEGLKGEEQGKYENIISTCAQGEDGLIKDDSSCTAFMEEFAYEGDSVCFDFLVLTPSYEIENYSFCEQREKIDWDEEFFNTLERTYPVSLKFVFKKVLFFEDRFQKIEISLIKGDAMEELSRIIFDKSIQVRNLYVEELEIARYNGYNYTEDIEFFKGINPKGVLLDSVEILQISYEDEEFIVNTEVYLLGQTYKTQFRMKSINVYSENPEESFFVRNPEDLERHRGDIIQNLNGFFIYLDQDISDEELNNYCTKTDEDDWHVESLFCVNFKGSAIKEDSLVNVDEYIKLQTEQASGNVIEIPRLLPISFTKDKDVYQL